MVITFFGARLCIRYFRIANARRSATSEIVKVRHLGACCRENRLFRTATRHRTRTQVRNKRPSTKNCRVARHQSIDVSQTCEHFGNFLYERTGKSRWRSCARLTSREQQNWHAAIDGGFKTTTRIGCELKWRNNEAIRLTNKWTRAPLVFATCDVVQHSKRRVEVIRVNPRSADVFCCAADTQIAGVDIHFGWVWQIAGHDRALIKVDVLHLIDKSRDVICIL